MGSKENEFLDPPNLHILSVLELLQIPLEVALSGGSTGKVPFQDCSKCSAPTCCAMKRKGCCSHPGPLPKCPTRLKNHLLWEKNVSNAAEKEKWKSFQRKFSPVQVEKTRLLASLSSLLILIKDFTTASTLKNIFSFGICTILPIGKHLLNIICCQKSSISTFVEWLPRTSSRWKSSSSCCSVLTYEISAWDVLYLRWRESPRSFPTS